MRRVAHYRVVCDRRLGAPTVNTTAAVISRVAGDDVVLDHRRGLRIHDAAAMPREGQVAADSIVCDHGRGAVEAPDAGAVYRRIGADCVAGFGTEVARSFWGREVWTHSNYIGDSVIGNNVSFGAGMVTGNLRLDEKNVQIECDGQKVDCQTNKVGLITGNYVRVGINASTMPGISIGSNSIVGPGVILNHSISNNKFVRGEVELKISDNKLDVASLDRKTMQKKL